MWSTLKKLNNPPSSKSALEIVRADKSISRDVLEVLERWHSDISKLFSGIRDNPEMAFDEEFYQQIIQKKKEFEDLDFSEQIEVSRFSSEELNAEVSFDEVSKTIDKVKDHKAYLQIPNEALRNNNAKTLIFHFLRLCFRSGLNPVDWDLSDIKPIPKKDKDPRDPLQNRCITLMCCIAKIYSKLLNARLQKYLASNNLLVEEQNGFRASRSCIDHLFVLCTVLRNRKLSGQETFLSFIDYKKAFDSVDRNLLLYKLSQFGINGNMYKAISSMYSNPKSRIILNDFETDYFDCPIGVKQGDCLSPTLFAIFINDLASEIKALDIGVNIGDELVLNILLYADDIVLLAESEADLQLLLFVVECWCKKWRLEINLTKTNILHVRPKRKQQSKFTFLFDMRPIAYCQSYKYLGANLNEFLDFDFTAEAQADAAGRSLSAVITKMIKNGGFPFSIYSLLYDVCVTSVSDYSAEIFGYTQYQPTLKLHLRAIRAFLGLPKNVTSCAALSEVDWLLPKYRGQIRMVRLYHRILKMEDCRLTKKVFLWDRKLNDANVINSWSSEIKSIFYSSGLNFSFNSSEIFPLKQTISQLKVKFAELQQSELKAECSTKPKLRTFNTFKDFSCLPSYVSKPLTFIQRKFISKTRTGCLSIRIELGRFSRPQLPENERICLACIVNPDLSIVPTPEIENEYHFIFECNRYKEIRDIWLSKLDLPSNFNNSQHCEKLQIVLNEQHNVKLTAQFILDAYNIRSKVI